MIIAPSVLSADFAMLAQECLTVIQEGADWLHLDVMDNHFVPNLTFGPPVIQKLRVHLPDSFMDCHLMVTDPLSLLPALAKASVDQIVVHAESFGSTDELKAAVKQISLTERADGRGKIRAGVVVSPDTAESAVPDMKELAMVLVMTVYPGYGGQQFINKCLDKVRALRTRMPHIPIQVDGGIDETTVSLAAAAGATVFVAGSAIFGHHDRRAAIAKIRHAASASAV